MGSGRIAVARHFVHVPGDRRRAAMIGRTCLLRSVATSALLMICAAASAQAPVKIAVIAEFTGPFADYGTQIHNGMKAYLKLHGDTFGGRKVEILLKDT